MCANCFSTVSEGRGVSRWRFVRWCKDFCGGAYASLWSRLIIGYHGGPKDKLFWKRPPAERRIKLRSNSGYASYKGVVTKYVRVPSLVFYIWRLEIMINPRVRLWKQAVLPKVKG